MPTWLLVILWIFAVLGTLDLIGIFIAKKANVPEKHPYLRWNKARAAVHAFFIGIVAVLYIVWPLTSLIFTWVWSGVRYVALLPVKMFTGFWNWSFWTDSDFGTLWGNAPWFGGFAKWVATIFLGYLFLAAVVQVFRWILVKRENAAPRQVQSLWQRLKANGYKNSIAYTLPTYSRGILRTFEDISRITKPRGKLTRWILGGLKFKLPWIQTVDIISQELRTLEGLETEFQFTAGDLEVQQVSDRQKASDSDTSEAKDSEKAKGVEYGREQTRMLGPQAKFRMMLRYYIFDVWRWLRQEPDVRNERTVRDRYFRQVIEGTTQRAQSKMRIPDMKNIGGSILLFCSVERISALKSIVKEDISKIPSGSSIQPPSIKREVLDDPTDLYLRDTDADAYWRWLEANGNRLGIIPHVKHFYFEATPEGRVVNYDPEGNHYPVITHLSKVDPNSDDHVAILEAYFEKLGEFQPHALQLRFWRDGILVAELQSKDVEPEKDIVTAITELGKASIKRNQRLVELRSDLDRENMVYELRQISARGDVAKARIWLEDSGLPVTSENLIALLRFHQVFRTMEEMAKAEGRGGNFVLSLGDILRQAGISGVDEFFGSGSGPRIQRP